MLYICYGMAYCSSTVHRCIKIKTRVKQNRVQIISGVALSEKDGYNTGVMKAKALKFPERKPDAQLLPVRPSVLIAQVGLFVLATFGLFLYLTFPGAHLRYSVDEAATYKGFNGFYPIEHNPAGRTFVWSKNEAFLAFSELPRYVPLTVYLEMSLDRPIGQPLAQIQIDEVNDSDNSLVRPLATIVADPKKPGFQRFTVQVPARPDLNNGLTLQITSNAFREAGNGRLLGVVLSNFEMEQSGDPWQGLFWPLPLIPAILLLMLVAGLWVRTAGGGLVETGGILLMIALTASEQALYLRPYSWWLVACGVGLAVCAVGWSRLPKGNWRELSCLLAGIAIFVGYFIVAHDYEYDVGLYREWLNSVATYGPFDIYSHSDTYNYPPLLGYILWFYNLILSPLGIASGRLALKGLMSLSVLVAAWLIWQQLKTALPPQKLTALAPVLLLFGLSTATLYNPAVWGQADAVLAMLLVLAFCLLYRDHYFWAAMVMALSLLFKPQAIFVVPLLALVLLKKTGWRQTLRAVSLSVGLYVALALPGFGFRLDKVGGYFFQDQLAGSLHADYIIAYNFPDLFDYETNPQAWIVILGLGLIALSYLGLAFYVWKGRAEPGQIALGAALAVGVFFTFAPKMHERYLYYALPFLALAAGYAALYRLAYRRRLGWLWIAYSLLTLLEPAISRYYDEGSLLTGSVFNWSFLITRYRDKLETGLSLAAVVLIFWIGVLLFQIARTERSQLSENKTYSGKSTIPPATASRKI